jgi:hypothetical protein
MSVGSLVQRMSASASAILIAILVVMAAGTFSLLGLQFRSSWLDLVHADRVSLLAASDRVIYETAEIVRTARGQVQSTLLAQDEPRAAVAGLFANTDVRMQQVFHDVPPDLAENTATRLAGIHEAWGKAADLRDGRDCSHD